MIRVGTSGYQFADWKGTFYPASIPARDVLPYYAERFDVVEINATYYRILPAKSYEGMLRRVPKSFGFVIKAYGGLTHQAGIDPIALAQYLDSLRPLIEGERLLHVLFQYPFGYRNTEENRRKALELCDSVAPASPAVEFRHASWDDEAVRDLLSRKGVTWCSVDEPPLPGLLPPVAHLTTPRGYVRLHGRNKREWFGKDRDRRYHYHYSDDELAEWVPRVKEMDERARDVVVFFNNCHEGNAPNNALRFIDLLSQSAPPAPF